MTALLAFGPGNQLMTYGFHTQSSSYPKRLYMPSRHYEYFQNSLFSNVNIETGIRFRFVFVFVFWKHLDNRLSVIILISYKGMMV